jgi:O-methyltransferase/methyltransferase family protein
MSAAAPQRSMPAMPVSERDLSGELARLINGYQVSQAIHVATVLGIPDLLGDGPRSSDALAHATQSHPASLYRLLRALASVGILAERDDRQFALAPLGKLLRSDAASSANAWAQLIGRPNYWHAWGDLLGGVKTGTIPFENVHGATVWDYRARRPDEADIFNRAMAAITDRIADAVSSVHDFSRYARLVDVGGGEGAFIAGLLGKYPSLEGVLFDQPAVVARGRDRLDQAGVSSRCEVIGGNFFEAVPAGGDAYLLKWILHDWSDADATAILRCCRRAIRPAGRLVIVEHLIGPHNARREGKFMDLNMMVITGGVERTREQFAALFEAADFELTRVTLTATAISVIEAAPRR